MRTRKQATDAPQRDFTVEDWRALYFVHRLMEQVALHGAPALRTFLAAAKEFPEDTRP